MDRLFLTREVRRGDGPVSPLPSGPPATLAPEVRDYGPGGFPAQGSAGSTSTSTGFWSAVIADNATDHLFEEPGVEVGDHAVQFAIAAALQRLSKGPQAAIC